MRAREAGTDELKRPPSWRILRSPQLGLMLFSAFTSLPFGTPRLHMARWAVSATTPYRRHTRISRRSPGQWIIPHAAAASFLARRGEARVILRWRSLFGLITLRPEAHSKDRTKSLLSSTCPERGSPRRNGRRHSTTVPIEILSSQLSPGNIQVHSECRVQNALEFGVQTWRVSHEGHVLNPSFIPAGEHRVHPA